jgi:virginiamycin B lyase
MAALVVTSCGGAAVPIAAPTGCGVVNEAIGGGLHYSEYCTSEIVDSISAGPDGAVWFMERTELNNAFEKIGRITSQGVTREYTITGATWLGGFIDDYAPTITTGPDGALWFTGISVHGGYTIGRMTTSGSTRFFQAVDPNYLANNPWAIATGPDGALWFTIQNGGVGRITTAGVATTFTCVACQGHSPLSIIAGPDGALWFAVYGGLRRIATSGVIDERWMTGPSTLPVSLTLGPDGAIWFTQRDAKIGRMTSAGVATNFPVPGERTANGSETEPTAITTGPDGALWFTHYSNRIGRITTSGVVTEYPIPVRPGFIITGPDHALWFVEGGKRIGRVSLA